MKLIDISQPLRDGMPVWPGDTEFSFELFQTKEESESVNVGRISISEHTGTHIDAPFHFDSDGEKVLDLDPSIYVGPARVIDIGSAESIGERELIEHDLDGVQRLLIRTSSWTDRSEFPTSVTYIRPDAAHFLSERHTPDRGGCPIGGPARKQGTTSSSRAKGKRYPPPRRLASR